MILSNKQAMMLFDILRDSLAISDAGNTPFGFNQKTRTDIYNQILNQQKDKLVNLEDKKDEV